MVVPHLDLLIELEVNFPLTPHVRQLAGGPGYLSVIIRAGSYTSTLLVKPFFVIEIQFFWLAKIFEIQFVNIVYVSDLLSTALVAWCVLLKS